MFMETIKLSNAPEVKKVIVAGFPGYKKHNGFLSVFPENGVRINSYWDGGTREEFVLVELATLKRKPLPTSTHPYFDIAAQGLANTGNLAVSVDHVGNITLRFLPDGIALVSAGYFCGKPATARVFLNQANMAKLLPDAV